MLTYTHNFVLTLSKISTTPPGGYSIYPWVGRCGPAPQALTLLKTKVVRFLIPCLRHLIQNRTLFKTFPKKGYSQLRKGSRKHIRDWPHVDIKPL